MNECQELMIEHYQPTAEFHDLVKDYEATYGTQVLDLAYRLRLIEQNLGGPNKPHIKFQMVNSFLETITAQDPTYFHFDIARHTLSLIAPEALKRDQAIDMLARELTSACNILHKLIKPDPGIVSGIKSCEEITEEVLDNKNCLKIAIFPNADNAFEGQFYSGGLSLWDHAYLNLLKSTGPRGRKEARKLRKHLKQQSALLFWFREPDLKAGIHYFHSNAFIGLAAILWEDIVKRRVHFHEHQVPALTTNVYLQTARILCPKTTIVQQEKSVQIIDGSDLIGIVNIPTIPANLLQAVFKGLPKLNSVYGHRLFRYEVQEPFRKKDSGDTDFRVIKLDGGKSELAELLGFRGKKAGTILGEILHAQAYLEFRNSESSGNLIQLTKYTSPTTKRDEGLLITVGTMLLPYYIFQEGGGLLIPLLKDPPLFGPNQYQACLFSLQMDLVAELSKLSMELYTHGAVMITPSRWSELFSKNGISPSFGKQVHERWTSDGDDNGKFLEMVEENYYTLGSEYVKEITFLTEQGRRRTQASHAGKISASKMKYREKK